MKELKDEISRLHAENVALQQGYDAARLEIEALRSRQCLHGISDPSGWMPIETAPEDGSLLILTDGEKVFRGAFAKVEFKEHRDADGNYIDQTDPDAYCLNFDDRDVCHPTHWQPEPALPAPPQGAANKDES